MEGPLERLLILSRSIIKHSRPRKFLFLIGRFLIIFYSETAWPNEPKRGQRRFFRNQPIRNKNCLWWACLLTDWDEMSSINRGPSLDVSYQVSVHLAKWFQRRRILKISQSETRIACGRHVR
jgi:hypothetical protein